LNLYEKEKSIDETREFFEELVNQFIGCSRYWKVYIEQELKSKYHDNAEQIFERSLGHVLHIDLWKFYLNFFKERNAYHADFKYYL